MASYTIKDLIDEYIYQRQNRVSPNDALQLLARMVPDLTEKERKELSTALRRWELENEGRYQSAPPRPPQPLPPSQPGKVSPFAGGLSCPVCNTANPPDAAYCYACGELLDAVKAGETAQLYQDVVDNATFGQLSSMVLTVRGYENEPLRITITNQPLTVGRTSPESRVVPDIDLARYGAQEAGVSRLHATLQRENQTLVLTDKGSVNFTFINGEKLHPHEVRVVRDGDEIRFGRLTTRINFQRELRRLPT